MHQLDLAFLKRGASLRSIIHHGQSLLLSSVSDLDGRVDWIEVSSDVHIGAIVVVRNVPCGSVVEDSLLHVEAVCIGVEGLLIVEARAAELDDDLVATVWHRRKTEEVNFYLEEDFVLLAHVSPHRHVGLLIHLILIIDLTEIEDKSVIRELGSLDQRGVRKGLKLSSCWNEDVSAGVLNIDIVPVIEASFALPVLESHVDSLIHGQFLVQNIESEDAVLAVEVDELDNGFGVGNLDLIILLNRIDQLGGDAGDLEEADSLWSQMD